MAHTPVLLEETVAFLAVRQGGRYVDGTLGRAGHARAVAALGGEVLGIDHYGASAPAAKLFEAFGFTADAVVAAAKRVLKK